MFFIVFQIKYKNKKFANELKSNNFDIVDTLPKHNDKYQ